MNRQVVWLVGAIMLASCGDGGGVTPDGQTGTPHVDGSDRTDPGRADADTSREGPSEVVGSYCPGGCAEGEICVFADADATEVSCVDPRPDIWDDGSDDDKRLVDVSGGWWRKRVDGWDTVNARCNDGSPYAYYIRPASPDSPDVNRWLLFFKGGGGCVTDESCAQRWVTERSLMNGSNGAFSPTKGDSGLEEGIYYRDDPRNAVREWNMVHIYYCSSDFFAGEYGPTENPNGLWFRGKANTRAVVDELIAGFDTSGTALTLSSLADAEQVIVAGGSAGAAAARLYMDRIADWIKAASPGATVLGLSDAAFQPPFDPVTFDDTVAGKAYHAPVGPGSADDDCLEAHPDEPVICDDAVHLVNGHGQGEHYGAVDDGHLGVAASTEASGLDGLFVFMSQWDGKATSNSHVGGLCVRPECQATADCPAGEVCAFGLCFNGRPCTPEYCDPDDGLCWGPDHAEGCIAEIATLRHQCGADSDCEGDEVCRQGLCTEPLYLGCAESAACPTDYLCIKGRCQRPSTTGECAPGTIFDAEAQLCIEPVGCSPGGVPCGAGYGCLPLKYTPQSAAFSYGVRRELTGLFESAGTGVFVPDNATHTAARSEKYFAQVGGGEQPSLRIRGVTFAEALGSWLAGDGGYREFIAPPIALPLPLQAIDIVHIDTSQLSARTEGSGCQDDALMFAVCPAGGCDDPTDAMALATVGDTSATAVAGNALAEASAITLVLAARPGCDVGDVSVPVGDFLAIRYQKSAPEDVFDLAIGLPPTISSADLPVMLHVGVDGATYQTANLTQKPVGPRVR